MKYFLLFLVISAFVASSPAQRREVPQQWPEEVELRRWEENQRDGRLALAAGGTALGLTFLAHVALTPGPASNWDAHQTNNRGTLRQGIGLFGGVLGTSLCAAGWMILRERRPTSATSK